MIAGLLQLLERRAGLDPGGDGQRERVAVLVTERARILGIPVDEYLAKAEQDESELSRVIDCATNGHTWFYRDARQIEAIERTLCTAWNLGRPVNVWVPGCSTGEDAYTLAMIAARRNVPIRILATDINERLLATARAGRYSAWSARELPGDLRLRLREQPRQVVEIAAADRAAVRFERHNLLEAPPPPPLGDAGWDLVLCRNVLIYFTPRAIEAALQNLAGSLSPDGWLFLSSVEVPHAAHHRIEKVVMGETVALRRARSTLPATPRPSPQPPRTAPPRPGAGIDELLESADAALERGSVAEACADFTRVLEIDPLHEAALLGAGVSLHLAGDSSAALRPLSAATLLAPSLWAAHYFLAICLENLGRTEEARRSYRDAVMAGDLPAPRAGGLRWCLHLWRRELLDICRRRAGSLSAPRVRSE